MMHDFAITRENVLFFDLPVVFDLETQPFPFRWDDDTPARVGVMPRGGGDADVQWFDVDPCYVFHPDERLRRRRHRRRRRRAPSHDVQARATSVRTTAACRRSTAGRSTCPRARSVKSASTSEARSSRVSTRRCSAHDTASATRWEPTTADAFDGGLYYKHDFVSGSSQEHDFGPGRVPAEFVFVAERGSDERGRRLADGLRLRRDDRPLRLRDPRRPRLHAHRVRSRPCTSRPGCRSASTATGSPTRGSAAANGPS